MTTHQPTIDILVQLLRDPDGYCPTQVGDHIDEKKLYEIAGRNKLQSLLFHFLSCRDCQLVIRKPWIQKTGQMQKAMIYHSLIWEKEKQAFDAFLKAHSIRGVLFKQCPRIPNQHNSVFANFQSKSDLDVLVPKSAIKTITNEYAKLGYKLSRKGARKEVQLINPRNGFKIDLHFLLAYPHYAELNTHELSSIRQFTDDLFKSIHKKKHRLAELSLEWYLLASAIRYWHNDLTTGLRDLKRIVELAQLPETLLLWDNIVSLAVKYNMKNELSFVLSVGSTSFEEPLPKKIQSTIPWWIRLIAASVSVKDIAVYPPITKWNWKKYIQQVDIAYKRYDHIKHILNINVKPYQIMQPKIYYYFIRYMLLGVKNQCCVKLHIHNET